MKRYLIFTFLCPPLVLLVYVADDMFLRGDDYMPAWLLTALLGVAYVLALIPAWLTAAVDATLSSKPLYLRIVITMPVAAILATLVARYVGQQSYLNLTTVLMGAIPAAVCSWLSSSPMRSVDA
jgi:hypothetical protein